MADEVEVKTISCFHQVKQPSFSKIHLLTSYKNEDIIVLSTGEKFLYLIKNEKVLNTILFPCLVTDFDVKGQIIIAASEDGKVWQIPVSGDKESLEHSDKDSVATHSPNQTIFSELLSDSSTANQNSSVPVTEVSTSQTILYEPNIQAIFSMEDVLICVGINDPQCSISLYTPTCGHGDDLSYDILAPHKYFLNCTKGLLLNDTWPLPVLCQNHGSSSADNILENKLCEYLLPNSSNFDIVSMLLLGSPEGRVWSCNLTAHHDTTSRFHLVWHLSEPVVTLCLAAIPIPSISKTTSNTSSSSHDICRKNVLLIVGKRGKCIIICHASNKCVYSESNISGPVTCCNTAKDYILYSNRKEICLEKLSFVNSNDAEPSIVLIPLNVVTITDVIAICPLELQQSCNAIMNIAVLTLQGKLSVATVPCSQRKTPFDICLKQPGNQLKDLLLSIENVALQTVLLEKDLEAIDKVLEQLNEAATVICKMKSNSNNVPSSKCIKWTVVPKVLSTQDASNTNRYYLNFKIHNQSKIFLGFCWSFLLQIKGCSSQNISECTTLTVSHSVNLDSLEHMKAKEFSIFLPGNFDLTNCLLIEASLCFNIQALLVKLPSHIQSDIVIHKCHGVLLPVGQTSIDVLDFAAISLSEINLTLCKFSAPIQPSHLDNVELLCENVNADNTSGQSALTNTRQQETIKIPLGNEILTCISTIVKNAHDRSPVQTDPGISHELSVFYFLLGYSEGTVKVILPTINPCSSTTSKHVLTVEVKSVENGVEVVLQAPSKKTLYPLLEAVVFRIQSFVHYCMANHSNAISFQEILKNIEAIKSKVIPQTDLVS